MNLWPHQKYAIETACHAIVAGERRICITSPTGGGKSIIAERLATFVIGSGGNVALYSNRKLLTEQITRNLSKKGIDHGVRAADYQSQRDKPFQVCSFQTEHARCVKSTKWTLHDARLVLVDEAHVNKGPAAEEIIKRHVDAGATVVGITATPLDIGHIYDQLIVAGTVSELQRCGALVPARHYGCDEPDLNKIGPVALAKLAAGDDLTEAENTKAIMAPGVHARVLEWWRRLNPRQLPTILFAPGVKESLFFAEEFNRVGVRAAHIDGDHVWIDGEMLKSTQQNRDLVLEMSRDGRIKIVCNRFVLREGIDAPWLAHGIFATVFGSLQSYLQSGGRLLRNHPGMEHVTVQDHGGNWWRHGSLNADREWNLGLTSRIATGLRMDSFDPSGTEKPAPKPFVCPQCKMTLVFREVSDGLSGKCPGCGHVLDFRKRSRPVVQTDGTLTEHPGDPFRVRKTRLNDDTEAIWMKCYYRALKSKSGMTFNQAAGLFAHENGYHPPRHLRMMPRTLQDWYMPVKSIPREKLR